jgi:hypothetical protein
MADERVSKPGQQDQEYEITTLQNEGALHAITKAEVDVQITTAHTYPRSLSKYQVKAMTMLTLNKEVAEECFYVIPRGGKTIEGPSVRLAEIVAASYGNLRCGARVVAEEDQFVVAQGICHDLENNVAITFETKRRIVNSRGQRYDSDMIGVTGNAASAIAFRNSVFRVVPKVLWIPLYEKARDIAKGDEKTFGVKREATLIAFEKIGVPRKKIFAFLKIDGINDMNSEHIITLIGIGNSIKSGEAHISDLDVQSEPSVPRRASESAQAPASEAPKEAAQEAAAQAPTAQGSTEPAKPKNGNGKPAQAGTMFDHADVADDPVVSTEQIQQFFTKLFSVPLKKPEIIAYIKKHFKVEQVKDLHVSEMNKALEALIPKR